MKDDPRDQADGFFESDDDWARREAMGAYDDVWDFVFGIDRLGALGEWDEMRRDLEKFKGDIPYHHYSEKAFRNAAEAGRTDILELMLAKKFPLSADDGAELIGALAADHLPDGESAIAFLLQRGFRGDKAVFGVAAAGAPATMELLNRHGCDILMGGDAFPLALHAGNTGMMKYLYDQGADIYTPACVKGLYGGIENYQARNPDHVAGPAEPARKFHESLCDFDAGRWTAFYGAAAGPSPSLEEFRAVPDGVADRGITLLQLAARAGFIETVIDAALRESKNPLAADDLLRPSESGASALSVLAARGDAHKIFDARLWWRRPEEAEKLRGALTGWNAGGVLDPAAFAAELQRQRLKESAGSAPRLKIPRP